MSLGLLLPARHRRIDIGVRPHLGGVEDEFLAPHRPGLLTQRDHMLKEAQEVGRCDRRATLSAQVSGTR